MATFTGNGLEAYTDDGTGVVTSGGTSAPAAGTSESWTVSVTTAFPVASTTASPPTYFYVADQAAGATEQEKVLVTVCPGGTGTQTWTVTRGADGTATAAHNSSGFTVQQVITGASMRGVQRFGVPVYQAADFGVKFDGGTTDNGPILNKAFLDLWSSGTGQGGIIEFPACGFQTGGNTSATVYSTVIIPPFCGIRGQGKQKSMIRLAPSSNCDVIQTMTYNSSAQAAILGVSAGTLQNCFYGQISGLTIHGSWNYQTATAYYHCINITTSPATSAAPGDPDFDPYNLIYDVECRFASGDGLYHVGRGGLQVTDSLFRYCQGNGITPSFDSLYTNVDLGENGICGLYLNHGSTNGAGVKSYNNGGIPLWVSGTSYSAGGSGAFNSRVYYSGVIYGCILSTSGTTPPPSDSSHWTAISAYTSPQAFGWDYYFDSNAYEACWSGCDSQEPTVGSYYFKGSTGCNLQGVSNRPNWDNPNTGVQLGVNPNNYGTCAGVVLDAATGCNVSMGYNVYNSAAYAARLINSATRCSVIIAGDGTDQAAFDGSTSTVGNFVVVDGAQAAAGQSSSAQSVASSGTITTTGIGVARVTTAGAVTGVILQAGQAGQQVTVINESANSITFAASGTSHVADGVADVIAATSARTFVYDSGTSLWYRTQ